MKRILIIPGDLQENGAERIAANFIMFAPEGEFEFHYLLFDGFKNDFGPEIESHGGKVITVPPPSSGRSAYAHRLAAQMRENRYDAVWSSSMIGCWLDLLIAKQNRIPVRIGQALAERSDEKGSHNKKPVEWIRRKLINWSATDLLACGSDIGERIFGIRAFSGRGHVFHIGIDTDALAFSEKNRERYTERIAERGFGTQESYKVLCDLLRGKGSRRKAAVSLSFDDGRRDGMDVFDQILKRYALPATFSITTGYVDGTCPKELCPSEKPALTPESVARLWQDGSIEIAMHGDRHQNTVSDICECRRKLCKWLGLKENTAFGFASPGSDMSRSAFYSSELQEFRASILYMRHSLRVRSVPHLRIICRKIARVIHLPFLYRIAYADTIMYFRDDKIVYSVPVLKDVTLAQVKSIVRLCIKRRGNLTLMFHSILPDTSGEDNWSWDWDKLDGLCSWLKEQADSGMLNVCTTAQLFDQMEH